MFVSRTDYGEIMSRQLFSRAALWSEYGPFPFSAYPNCTVRNAPLNNGKIARVLGDSLAYGPFWVRRVPLCVWVREVCLLTAVRRLCVLSPYGRMAMTAR
jgi:hypothetical protein